MENFDLTPDPKILIALTHTPLKPLEALCELIDNAIDSIQAARLMGQPANGPMVIIELPKQIDMNHGQGKIVVRDSGPGMDPKTAERALRAGYSGNNPFDSLGLFGMGFNISSGKLGSRTRLLTATKGAPGATEVVVDLEEINRSKSYLVPFRVVEKPAGFESGTLVEISGWWPEGNPNSGFAKKLVQYGPTKIREELGRIYSSCLREKLVQIVVSNESVQAFEHCVWAETRFVERQLHGKIYAKQSFDETVGQQTRCTNCYAKQSGGQLACPACGSSSSRTIDERIRGWVGIQRFDDLSDFGVDLIRNGRCIRVEEKQAFFEFVDEFKRTIKDYPIDQGFGRIVGEVHLNHVPVDFQKQDFQRSSPEWHNAIKYLRGESSLQPKQEGANKNNSPLYKLYQGYRKVRTAGKAELYMGVWDAALGQPSRISREKEKEFIKKFEERIPGYYDDEKWWEQVLAADQKPLEELVDCPACGAQNLKNADVCVACEHILQAKVCVNPECGFQIPMTAVSCPKCGRSQVQDLKRNWKCHVCGKENLPETDKCLSCDSTQGTLNPLSLEHLRTNSEASDRLSIPSCTVALANGSQSSPLKVTTYLTKASIVPGVNMDPLPLVSFRQPGSMDVFLDASHHMFKTFQVKPEEVIAAEIAGYIFEVHRQLAQFQGLHTPVNIQWQVLKGRWAKELELSPEHLQSLISTFFEELREQLPTLLEGLQEDVFSDLNVEEQKELVDEMHKRGADITRMEQYRHSGAFLGYVGADVVSKLLQKYPDRFFDGKFWQTPFGRVPGLSDEVLASHQKRMKTIYFNCLSDIIAYQEWNNPDPALNRRADAALQFLLQKKA